MTLEVWNGVSGTTGNPTTATTINVAGLDSNAWAGANIRMLSGPASGQSKPILANTGTSVTCEAFSPVPTGAGGDSYRILPEAKGSSRFTCTVGGSASFTWGRTKACNGSTRVWTANDLVEESWTSFNSDVSQTVVVHRLAGAITTYSFFPSGIATGPLLVAGDLQFTLPTDKTVEITINGDNVNRMVVRCNPLSPTLPAHTTFDGSQVNVGAATCLYFPPGVWTLRSGTWPSLFAIKDGGQAYLALGAYVMGNFDIRSHSSIKVTGSGILSGEYANGLATSAQGAHTTTTTQVTGPLGVYFSQGYWNAGLIKMTSGVNNGLSRTVSQNTATTITHAAFPAANSNGDTFTIYGGSTSVVGGISFSSAILFTSIVGADSSGTLSMFQTTGNVVERITIVDPSYYDLFFGSHTTDRLLCFSSWTGGAGSIAPGTDYVTKNSVVTRCFMLEDDDTISLLDNEAHYNVDSCVIVHRENAAIRFGYWPDDLATGYETTVSNLTVRSVCKSETDEVGHYGSIFGSWTDGIDGTQRKGRESIVISNAVVEGSELRIPLFDFRNLAYPYGGGPVGGLQYGSTFDVAVNGLTSSAVPATKSLIQGKNWISTPHDIDFSNVVVAGVPVTVWNYSTYFDINPYPYNITFGGHPVVTAVDICNMALSYIGDPAKITAIAPPDGSAQAAICARFYNMARDGLLNMAAWSFASRRKALVASATAAEWTQWTYAYDVPTDAMRLLSILPDDATDDFAAPTFEQQNDNQLLPGTIASSYVPQTYALELNSVGNPTIYTNQESAVCRYIAFVTDTNLFSPLFVTALAYHLASMLAGPLMQGNEGADESKRCTQMMMAYLAKAGQMDGNQRQVRVEHVVPWVSGR